MKGLILEGVKTVALKDYPKPAATGRDALVKLEARGICGTDLASYRSGAANGFGHEMSGIICEVGSESTLRPGTRVFVSNLTGNLASYCAEPPFAYMGGFADYILVKNAEPGKDLYPVPDEMSYAEAALVEPFCVSMSGVKKYGGLNENTKAVVIGAGIIGMCALAYLKARGVKTVAVCDVIEERLAKAKELGGIPVNSAGDGFLEELGELFGTTNSFMATGVPDVDLYIDAAGVGPLLNKIVGATRVGTQITVLAVHHRPPELNMMAVMYNSVRLLGSCMFDHDDIVEAIDILSKDHGIAKVIVSHEYPMDEATEAFRTADDPKSSMKVMLVGQSK